MQEDKAASVRIINDMNAALKGRAVQVISLHLLDRLFIVAFCEQYCEVACDVDAVNSTRLYQIFNSLVEFCI